MGWRTHISREVSGSFPSVGLGISSPTSTSKFKLQNQKALPRNQKSAKYATLTPAGQAVKASGRLIHRLSASPRLILHAGMIGLVGGIVLTGSTGHSSKLNPLANRVGYGSVLEQAAAVEVAAQVADSTDLLVTSEVTTDAKNLNAQVALATSDDGTLAKRQVVDTAGAASRGVIEHKVESGETLSSVAAEYNVTTDTVRWANSLGEGDNLSPGKVLTILPISGIQYKVSTGDSPESLAQKYQSNADQIIAFNNAEVNGLQPGQVIVIPDGVMPQAPRPAASSVLAASTTRSTAPAKVSFAPGSRANGYSYGYCTYYVASKRAVPGSWGNARTWYGNAQISGYGVGSVPQPGAIAWTGAGYYGHVAFVESVSGGMVTVSEMNYNGWNRVSTRTVPASTFRYIY